MFTVDTWPRDKRYIRLNGMAVNIVLIGSLKINMKIAHASSMVILLTISSVRFNERWDNRARSATNRK